jgi:uncharacterized protein YecT (DUF1311 family)
LEVNSVKKALFLVAFLVASVPISSQEPPPRQNDPCFDKATTQSDLTTCATEGLKKADAELNLVYRQLLKKYAARKNLITKLKLAEEAWVKFRDAHIESLYSESDEGSVYPMCKAMELTRLTVERTKALKNMLDHQEGDVCAF